MRLANLFCRLGIFVFLSSCAAHKSNSADSFSGQYCTLPNFTAYCYTLHKDHRFDYALGSCTYSRHGQGHYAIVKDSIHFHFEDAPGSSSRPQINIQKLNSRTDSLLVDVQVFEDDENPLIGYTAAFLEGAEIKGGRIGDVNGQLTWRALSDRPRRMRLSYTGYEPVWIDLDAGGKYKVTVHMANTLGTEMPPQTITYRLVSLNADSLVLGAFSEHSTHALYKWDKSSKKKAQTK